MKKLYFILFLIAFTVTTLVLTNRKGEDKDYYVMGFTPSENADVVQTNGEALAALLKERIGISFRTYVALDYSALVLAMKAKKVDFAFMAPTAYVQAEEMAGAIVLLKSVRKGNSEYYSALIVRKDSPIRTLEDMRGRKLAWGYPNSTAGYIFPKMMLLKRGIDPEKFFGQTVTARGHDAICLSVYNGHVDGGFTFADDTLNEHGAWKVFLKDGKSDEIRPILYTPPIPGDNFATRRDFMKKHPELVEKVKNAILDLKNDEKGRELLKNLYQIDYMVPATYEDYQPIRDAWNLVISREQKEEKGTDSNDKE
ncbi:phosphate/phosphite/phosphonate ABC transporter substrate-binding protein [bacterium]|nr:phosphate/phosphite/phosphonate ABC transporter substrate-binding protein [bacterium]